MRTKFLDLLLQIRLPGYTLSHIISFPDQDQKFDSRDAGQKQKHQNRSGWGMAHSPFPYFGYQDTSLCVFQHQDEGERKCQNASYPTGLVAYTVTEISEGYD